MLTQNISFKNFLIHKKKLVVKKPDDEMTIKSLNNGWAEQDPFLWWGYVCQSSKE